MSTASGDGPSATSRHPVFARPQQSPSDPLSGRACFWRQACCLEVWRLDCSPDTNQKRLSQLVHRGRRLTGDRLQVAVDHGAHAAPVECFARIIHGGKCRRVFEGNTINGVKVVQLADDGKLNGSEIEKQRDHTSRRTVLQTPLPVVSDDEVRRGLVEVKV